MSVVTPLLKVFKEKSFTGNEGNVTNIKSNLIVTMTNPTTKKTMTAFFPKYVDILGSLDDVHPAFGKDTRISTINSVDQSGIHVIVVKNHATKKMKITMTNPATNESMSSSGIYFAVGQKIKEGFGIMGYDMSYIHWIILAIIIALIIYYLYVNRNKIFKRKYNM